MEQHVLATAKETKQASLTESLQEACKKIAPLWPLENFVAVNPFLGFTGQTFERAAQQLSDTAGIRMTLPLSFYRNKIREGKIKKADLLAAFQRKSLHEAGVEAFIRQLEATPDFPLPSPRVSTLADVASQVSSQDWIRFSVARISAWAASYFDSGQALWQAADSQLGAFESWKREAQIDLTPEISGLKGFRKMVRSLPDHPLHAAQAALDLLGVPDEGLPFYLHRLLLRVGGWAAHAARLDWDSELYGKKGGYMVEFLTVLLCWEACLLRSLPVRELNLSWMSAKKNLSEFTEDTEVARELSQSVLLQDAFELSIQRELFEKFQGIESMPYKPSQPTLAQAIFCIDVRSEVFRRNLEQADQRIETMGFAGFFAFPIQFVPLARGEGEAQCPVLIPTGPTVLEVTTDKASHEAAYKKRILHHQVSQVWRSFKSGAVTCFSFVSPLGISFLPKLFTDSFGITRPVPHPDQAGLRGLGSQQKGVCLEEGSHGDLVVGIPVQTRIQLAKNALKAMSLTENFARFVLVVGHGSTTVNNPHATGLDCGACGGHTGEANAKVAAAVLNDRSVREGLTKESIAIPEDTIFLACLHDTTTDEVTIYNEWEVPSDKMAALEEVKASLAKAGKAARTERALRMAIDTNQDKAVIARSKDWSQIRPEWGLAGCTAFVVAPRERTKGLDLGGKSFLHSYNWKQDRGFSVLELIMTAPMVVTSWINLQYYGSTVDNKHFGSGNKTLHNVTAGLGVLEGHSGDLRVGLPFQSVHDGEKYQHEPARLSVVIEAPLDAMNEVLAKHPAVRNLCDNGWIYLFAMDEQGKVAYRYMGDLQWECV
jgi:uncharacterized protein YbcC (UPF0753/DUF2309 family)